MIVINVKKEKFTHKFVRATVLSKTFVKQIQFHCSDLRDG